MVNKIGKYTGYLLLFLAMLVLFAHAFVPHHHHNQQVCIENAYCTHPGNSTSHPAEDGLPDGDKANSCCLFNQHVIIPKNQWKQEFTSTAIAEFPFCEMVIEGFGYWSAEIPVLPLFSKPERLFNPLSISASIKHRAPPKV